ncbi:hypothetical protein Golob_008700 [Gossypium lobatum]|uniref:Auxin-responsive protein n=1 Tax=Gossypium lobatum TaxID=34289 RepID=A0A7J8MGJ6_9ROSI|nr:hypothetical protein [Gossypium lobatum]
MDCLVLPICLLGKRRMGSRLGYRRLTRELEPQVRVVVGKEKREFWVDPLVLEESPFRVLMETLKKGNGSHATREKKKKVIFVDVDAILFEHMLWLMNNDSSSLFQLDLHDIIDFYAQDY